MMAAKSVRRTKYQGNAESHTQGPAESELSKGLPAEDSRGYERGSIVDENRSETD